LPVGSEHSGFARPRTMARTPTIQPGADALSGPHSTLSSYKGEGAKHGGLAKAEKKQYSSTVPYRPSSGWPGPLRLPGEEKVGSLLYGGRSTRCSSTESEKAAARRVQGTDLCPAREKYLCLALLMQRSPKKNLQGTLRPYVSPPRY